jgi:uncharacterized membrane protein YgdD (TMEM256/DUF423 family)
VFIHPVARFSFVIGFLFLSLGVLFGAFGAHILKNMVSVSKLMTFETGIRYHFYHALGLILIGIIQQIFQNLKLRLSVYFFSVGILLFSFNCYLYVISDVKFFAMCVPLGGILLTSGWVVLLTKFLKFKSA